MPNQYDIDPQRDAEIAALAESLGSGRAAGRELKISHAAVQSAIKRFKSSLDKADAPSVPMAGELPDDDIDIKDVIALQAKRFEKKLEHQKAKRWRTFNVPVAGPYALMFFGDPHVDDNGCHWPLLQKHCELAANTEALYAINIGDTTNNWVGRLAKLWANQDTSASTAMKMAKWLLHDSGVPWFIWLHGNHDMWDGPVSTKWFNAIKPHHVQMDDWQSKFTLRSPNGFDFRVWAAHNFKGNSIWNNLHGLERAAQMQDWAHLYVAGHHHDTGLRQGENPHRQFCYWLMRVRGYKFMDEYAELHGFGEHQFGASGLVVVDPDTSKPNAVQCFLDPFEGVEFLNWKRSKL
jgi:hypothetical protein